MGICKEQTCTLIMHILPGFVKGHFLGEGQLSISVGNYCNFTFERNPFMDNHFKKLILHFHIIKKVLFKLILVMIKECHPMRISSGKCQSLYQLSCNRSVQSFLAHVGPTSLTFNNLSLSQISRRELDVRKHKSYFHFHKSGAPITVRRI